MGHNSVSGQWNKVNISQNNSRFSLEKFDHEFMDNIDGCMIDENFTALVASVSSF